MEMERLRQTHSKEVESKDEEVEEIRQSCSKKVRLAWALWLPRLALGLMLPWLTSGL